MKIKNASDIPLNQNSGTVPDLSGALMNWFQKMTFSNIVKTVSAFQVSEVATSVDFLGVWQMMSPQQLVMKPEGQRSWKWFTCHSQTQLPLAPDDVLNYLGTQYRVKSVDDYSLYGYYKYDLIQDYTGSGPS